MESTELVLVKNNSALIKQIKYNNLKAEKPNRYESDWRVGASAISLDIELNLCYHNIVKNILLLLNLLLCGLVQATPELREIVNDQEKEVRVGYISGEVFGVSKPSELPKVGDELPGTYEGDVKYCGGYVAQGGTEVFPIPDDKI